MIDEATFRHAADAALESLFKALTRASDSHDFEADMNNGALTVEFDDPPAKFVVSPNAPVRQIWVSAHSKSFKLDWNAAASAFVLPDTGETLNALMAGHISKRLGEEVSL
jgi:iron donor protein CyaY